MSGTSETRIAEIETTLRELATIVRRRGRELMDVFDITPPQFNALLTLSEDGETTMGGLCERLHFACSTATDLVDRLERHGLVRRERDRGDRRVIRLRLLEQGERTFKSVLAAHRAYLERVLRGVSNEELEVLEHQLQRTCSLLHSCRIDTGMVKTMS